MNKIILIILLSCIFIFSCATAGRMNKIQAGMTRTQVIDTLGEPNSSAGTGREEHLVYRLYEYDAWSGGYERFFVRLIDGKVSSYGKQGDWDTTKDPTQVIKVR